MIKIDTFPDFVKKPYIVVSMTLEEMYAVKSKILNVRITPGDSIPTKFDSQHYLKL